MGPYEMKQVECLERFIKTAEVPECLKDFGGLKCLGIEDLFFDEECESDLND